MAMAGRLDAALQDEGLEGVGGGLTVPCKVASVVFDDAQRRFKLYSALVTVLVVLALAAIIAGVVLFVAVDEATATGVVTFVGGLLSGGLAGLIKGERDQARTDRDKAQEIIGSQCGGQTADQVVASLG